MGRCREDGSPAAAMEFFCKPKTLASHGLMDPCSAARQLRSSHPAERNQVATRDLSFARNPDSLFLPNGWGEDPSNFLFHILLFRSAYVVNIVAAGRPVFLYVFVVFEGMKWRATIECVDVGWARLHSTCTDTHSTYAHAPCVLHLAQERHGATVVSFFWCAALVLLLQLGGFVDIDELPPKRSEHSNTGCRLEELEMLERCTGHARSEAGEHRRRT